MESRDSASAGYAGEERRRKPRIQEPFPAKVRGIDCMGDPFEVAREIRTTLLHETGHFFGLSEEEARKSAEATSW